MVEKRPLQNVMTHGILILGIVVVIFPNHYLWPLIITADTNMTTIVTATNQMLTVIGGIPDWSNVMTTVMRALLPPVTVVVVMQRLFDKGLIETEK